MLTVGALIHDSSRLLKAEFERRARDSGLTITQWRVLGVLSRTEGGMRQAELAARLELSPMTVSDVVERLDGQGLVNRAPDPDDSRAKRVTLSEAALPVMTMALGVAGEVYDLALEGVSEDDRAALARALTRMIANLTDKTCSTDKERAP